MGSRRSRILNLDRTYKDTWNTRSSNLNILGFSSYQEYLDSDLWKSLREKAKTREHFSECYLCRSKENINLHHRSYKWIHLPILRNIISLCQKHHNELHDIAKVEGISVLIATKILINNWVKSGNKLAWKVREGIIDEK